MAYFDDQEEEEVVAGDVQPTTGQASSIIAPGQGDSSTVSNAAPIDNTITPSQGPSNFAGIMDYVNANKPQTARLANDLASGVTDTNLQAEQQLNDVGQQFNQAVDENTVVFNQDLVDQTKNNAASVTNDEDKKNQFVNQYNAEYKGPQNVETFNGLAEAQQSINDAQQKGQFAQTESGAQSLISDLQEDRRGKVNQGALTLNTALLRGDVDARETLANAGKASEGLGDRLSQFITDSNQRASDANATTQATKALTRETIDPLQGQIYSTVQDRQQELSQNLQRVQNLENAIRAGTPNDEQLADLGLDRAQWEQVIQSQQEYDRLFNFVTNESNSLKRDLFVHSANSNSKLPTSVANDIKNRVNTVNDIISTNQDKTNFRDFTPYIQSQYDLDYTDANNVATQEEMAQYLALNELIGQQNQALQYSDKAGSAVDPTLNFSLDDWISRINEQLTDLSSKEQQLIDARKGIKKDGKIFTPVAGLGI